MAAERSLQQKLKLTTTPLKKPSAKDAGADVDPSQWRRDEDGDGDSLEFQRHEEATNAELFFDLFFAANMTVFSSVHEVTNRDKLSGFIGYLTMLWFTWCVVGLFDVRFVTDSIFERIARAAHLGVMVGFAVVAPYFDPYNQVKSTFRAFSIILCLSRLILAIQYGSIIWHVRKYPSTKVPLSLMVVLHTLAAFIYLGIAFRFGNYNSRVYIAWYIIAASETCLIVILSLFWKVLSFRGTHLMNRMSLLTMIILGEGIIVFCTNVTTIVKNPDSWTTPTIGVVISAVTTIYLVYQIYFDWMRHLYLPPIRQLIWAILHFPFHLTLLLLMEGTSQFVVWWKIMEVLDLFMKNLEGSLKAANDPTFDIKTKWIVDQFNTTVSRFLEQYPATYTATFEGAKESLEKLKSVPDSFWSLQDMSESPEYEKVANATQDLYNTMQNSIYTTFGIDTFKEIQSKSSDSIDFNLEASQENTRRFQLVFIYTFVTAGLVLCMMTILFAVTRMKRWSRFSIIRVSLTFLIGVSVSLVSLVVLHPAKQSAFVNSPWIVPMLCLVYFFVLVLNNLPKTLFSSGTKDQDPEGATGGGGGDDVNPDLENKAAGPETEHCEYVQVQTPGGGMTYVSVDPAEKGIEMHDNEKCRDASPATPREKKPNLPSYFDFAPPPPSAMDVTDHEGRSAQGRSGGGGGYGRTLDAGVHPAYNRSLGRSLSQSRGRSGGGDRSPRSPRTPRSHGFPRHEPPPVSPLSAHPPGGPPPGWM